MDFHPRPKAITLTVCSLLAAFMTIVNLEVSAQGPRGFANIRRELKTMFEQEMRKNGIVGSSFMLVKDNQVTAQEFFGFSDMERGIPVDENTIYHWASITKTFTAVAVMQLRDQGKLKLEDPVTKYIPELKQVNNPYGDMSEVTIRHLMTHTSGFQAQSWPWTDDKEWQPFEPKAWSQLVSMMPYIQLQFKPGTKFSYSNPGIIFLGRIIEVLSGEDYEVYVDKNIFKPLEMYRSYFDATPNYLLKHRAAGYTIKNGKLTPTRFDADTGITVSNGGLNSPITDMVRFINFLMGDPGKQELYNQILSRTSLLEMFEPVTNTDAQNLPDGVKESIGLSFFVEESAGNRLIGHSGNQNGFISHFYLRPGNRTAYIIVFNTNAMDALQDTKKLDREMKDYLLQNVFPLFVGR